MHIIVCCFKFISMINTASFWVFCRGENQPASNPGYDCTDMYVTLDGDRWRLIPCNDPTSTGNVLCEYQMLDLEEGWCFFK